MEGRKEITAGEKLQNRLSQPPPSNLGGSIFNTSFQSSSAPGRNPFALQNMSNGLQKCPNAFTSALNGIFGSPMPSTIPPDQSNQSATPFAQQADISSSESQTSRATKQEPPHSPWPSQSQLPSPYPSYHLDADYETLDPTPDPASSSHQASRTDLTTNGPSDATVEDKDTFESSIDKTFQRFADRLAQNPEQVLRYEFAGQPLLYSHDDAVGRLFSSGASHTTSNAKIKTVTPATARGIPTCPSCGANRVFELQLVPQAIAELEVDEEGLDGMDWGTIILGVCEKDCVDKAGENQWSWREEWAGVQWEDIGNGGKGKGR